MAPRPAAPTLPDPIPAGHPVLVAPAPGRRVRDNLTQCVVAADGLPIAWSTYWARRLDDQDITVAPVPPEPAAPASEA